MHIFPLEHVVVPSWYLHDLTSQKWISDHCLDLNPYSFPTHAYRGLKQLICLLMPYMAHSAQSRPALGLARARPAGERRKRPVPDSRGIAAGGHWGHLTDLCTLDSAPFKFFRNKHDFLPALFVFLNSTQTKPEVKHRKLTPNVLP